MKSSAAPVAAQLGPTSDCVCVQLYVVINVYVYVCVCVCGGNNKVAGVLTSCRT